MYFIKIIQEKRAPQQALVKLNDDQSLKQFIITYKGIEDLDELNQLEVFVGAGVTFDEINLYKVDMNFTLFEILLYYPSCTRILFKFNDINRPSATIEGNKENAFSKLMNNARTATKFPKRDAKLTSGGNKLWNLIVTQMETLNCGFYPTEIGEMVDFMNVLFNCLW